MRSLPICVFAVLAALTASCERVVELDLDTGPRRLVVEARLERILDRVTGVQSIILSTTGSYFDGAPPPPARGALVRVTDDAGTVTTFSESAVPGTYTTTSLTVQRGRTYALSINFEGQQYESTASTATVPPIDSLYFDAVKPGRFSGTSGVRATIDLTDPVDERNHYLWEQYVNGVRQLGPDTAFKMRIIASDDALNGLLIEGFQPFEGIEIPIGTPVVMRQIGISASMFRYYFALSDQVSGDGSVFSVPPASIRGNVANRTSPTSPALGYFSVSEVAEARATRRE